MGPTENDQQAAGAGAPADNAPGATPGQVVSPTNGASQNPDGAMTISHDDASSAAPPAAPVAPAADAPNPNDVSLADENVDPSQPTAIDSTPTGEPAVPSVPEPADSTVAPAADPSAVPSDPNAGQPPVAPQQ